MTRTQKSRRKRDTEDKCAHVKFTLKKIQKEKGHEG